MAHQMNMSNPQNIPNSKNPQNIANPVTDAVMKQNLSKPWHQHAESEDSPSDHDDHPDDNADDVEPDLVRIESHPVDKKKYKIISPLQSHQQSVRNVNLADIP